MKTCSSCSAKFFPQSPAWGDSTCGNCIADRIEQELMRGSVLAERKPLRRATSTSVGEDVYIGETQARAADQRRA